jgi:hypothetical protein
MLALTAWQYSSRIAKAGSPYLKPTLFDSGEVQCPLATVLVSVL